MQSQILVTGSRGGLGQFLCLRLNGIGLTRENAAAILGRHSRTDFDIIVHCANDDKNMELLQKILKLRHRYFVFLSSSDVYPDDGLLHSENESLNEHFARSTYAKEKINAEAAVLKCAVNPLVIRSSGLLGAAQYSANLKALLTDDSPVLTLTAESTWNFVTYDEVLRCILGLITTKTTGPINMARAEAVSVQTIAAHLEKTAVYGNYLYRVAALKNEKALQMVPELSTSSFEIFKNWLNSSR